MVLTNLGSTSTPLTSYFIVTLATDVETSGHRHDVMLVRGDRIASTFSFGDPASVLRVGAV